VFNNAAWRWRRHRGAAALAWHARDGGELLRASAALQRLAPSLAGTAAAAVVNIGSAAGLTNVPFMPTYSASKAALHSLTQARGILLGQQGTAVFGVYAGPVDTDMCARSRCPRPRRATWRFAILDGIEAGHEDIFPTRFGGVRPAVRGVAQGGEQQSADGRRDAVAPGRDHTPNKETSVMTNTVNRHT